MENIKKEKKERVRCFLCNKRMVQLKYRTDIHHICCDRRAFILMTKLMTNEELENRLKELYNR